MSELSRPYYLNIASVDDELRGRKPLPEGPNSGPENSFAATSGIAIRMEEPDPDLTLFVFTSRTFLMNEAKPELDGETKDDNEKKAAHDHNRQENC